MTCMSLLRRRMTLLTMLEQTNRQPIGEVTFIQTLRA